MKAKFSDPGILSEFESEMSCLIKIDWAVALPDSNMWIQKFKIASR